MEGIIDFVWVTLATSFQTVETVLGTRLRRSAWSVVNRRPYISASTATHDGEAGGFQQAGRFLLM